MFVKEMDSLNEELDAVLSEHEELITLRTITPHAIDYLLKKIQTLQHSDASLQKDLKQGLDNLRKSANMCDGALKEKSQLENRIQNLRLKALGKTNCNGEAAGKTSNGIGEIELDELERIWEEQGSDPTPECCQTGNDNVSSNVIVQPVNMDLFYGSSYHTNSDFVQAKAPHNDEVATA